MQPTATINSQPLTLDHEVCEIIEWNEEQLAEYKYQQGLNFLQCYLPCNAANRALLETSKMYWNWWKQIWRCHDEVFVANHVTSISLYHRQELYKELHNARLIADDGTKPPAVVTNLLNQKSQPCTL